MCVHDSAKMGNSPALHSVACNRRLGVQFVEDESNRASAGNEPEYIAREKESQFPSDEC
jgi:hypothetical protein